jgi:hypothetical protein
MVDEAAGEGAGATAAGARLAAAAPAAAGDPLLVAFLVPNKLSYHALIHSSDKSSDVGEYREGEKRANNECQSTRFEWE